MSESGGAPKIQVDSDWKSQAQAEKERLAQREREKKEKQAAAPSVAPSAGAKSSSRGSQLPPPSWDTLVSMMATQAIMYLGGIADPRTGQPMVDLDVARHQIDLLAVLEEKTRGNLSDEESGKLSSLLYDLRMRYLSISKSSSPLVAEAMGGGSGSRA
ncbi:MAG: DUF1844 domain-containing protein [Phycisphaerales bacterium]